MTDPTAPASDRRTQICDAAIALAATGGNRAVTHSAIDRALELPKGSTSYYFRTRRALLDAAITRLTAASSAAFGTLLGPDPAVHGLDDPAAVIADYLEELITERRDHVLARFAFAPDACHDDELARALAECLFSLPAAVSFFTTAGAADPHAEARDLVALCEGIAASALFTRSTPAADDLAGTVRRRFGRLRRNPPTS
ncbi:TetR/AcrR family transcriptional regulator [Gordonia zhaorongruii]|uniref:TetR/AcrR family transcriptional regulator n=1 Tax=Gordonia zhaorongruii TaxID=2597659 RepID=UPI001F342667|nr:TetR family transcriptional regulator [Gordonia zhaorongruii]